MSWDIVLFNSRQKIESIEELDEFQLEPTDFCSLLENHFGNIKKDDNHRSIIGEEYAIDYFIDDEEASHKILNLYGEHALFELIVLAKKHGWQIFDAGMGGMVDLDNPSENGYENFQDYLSQILKDKR
ncbi:hypothetical protein [Pedobacter frigoris]|uniref:hypothetical protein n=1 Tax=Pedobacter frigoris TaxID=2571272 RepID=UPI00293153CA|nr:hypothetical protein [Pedobacter frigoris]